MKQLWAHQKTIVDLALKQKNFAIFAGLGSGKTAAMITIVRYKCGEVGRVRKTVIFSPLITLGNWKREFAEFSNIKDTDVIVLKGTGRQKLAQFMESVTEVKTGTMTRNRIVLLNYECAQNAELMECLHHWHPEIMVLDEAHRVRNHSGKRAKTICKLADIIPHKYLLTGTPILNDAMDIFFPYRIMDGGKTFGDNFFAFRGKYFQDLNAGWAGKDSYFPDYSERPELFPELQRRMYYNSIGAQAHRVETKDCVDLPPLLKTTIEVELGSDQKKMYVEMRDEFLTYVEKIKGDGLPMAVVANLAITKAIRLQQITSGFVKAENGMEYPIKDNPRLHALKEYLEDAAAGKGQKIIVWCCFKRNYEDVARVCEELKLKYCMITGEQSAAQKEENMKQFRADPAIKIMIANQGAGGIGVNLVEAPIAIFYSRDFSLEKQLQAEARNYRGGSNIHEKVLHVDFIAKGTIDGVIADALAHKQSIGDQILNLRGRI